MFLGPSDVLGQALGSQMENLWVFSRDFDHYPSLRTAVLVHLSGQDLVHTILDIFFATQMGMN